MRDIFGVCTALRAGGRLDTTNALFIVRQISAMAGAQLGEGGSKLAWEFAFRLIDLWCWLVEKGMITLTIDGFRNKFSVDGTFYCGVSAIGH